jgi:hypothetical protein
MATSEALSVDSEIRIQQAIENLERRTLASIDTLLGRLVYVASTRDYNSGAYYHDGLAMQFGLSTAQAALQSCHRSLFRKLLSLPVSQLVAEVTAYLDTAAPDGQQIMASWQQFKAYQMLIPGECDSLSAELFTSNMKVSLAVLRMRILKARNSVSQAGRD